MDGKLFERLPGSHGDIHVSKSSGIFGQLAPQQLYGALRETLRSSVPVFRHDHSRPPPRRIALGENLPPILLVRPARPRSTVGYPFAIAGRSADAGKIRERRALLDLALQGLVRYGSHENPRRKHQTTGRSKRPLAWFRGLFQLQHNNQQQYLRSRCLCVDRYRLLPERRSNRQKQKSVSLAASASRGGSPQRNAILVAFVGAFFAFVELHQKH